MSLSTSPGIPGMDAQSLHALRRRATTRLGGATAENGPAVGFVDALGVLHALASSPDTAPDALALLHELQVHQVELELQSQELMLSRGELELALRRQAARHDALPVGCFVIDAGGVVVELNETAAGLLGLPRGRVQGQRIAAFFAGPDRQSLDTALAELQAAAPLRSFRLTVAPQGQAAQPVLARLGADTATGDALLCLVSAESR
jgi:PAS domain-containing protein